MLDSLSDDLPDELRARHPVPADQARVVAVLGEWWGEAPDAAMAALRPMLLPRLFFQHFTDTSCVVERSVDGTLVAFLIGLLSQSQPGVAYIHFVGIDPSLRGAGLGRTLYGWFFDEAAARGATTVRCITGPSNTASVGFHRALGFSLDPSPTVVDGIPVQPDYDGPGQDRVGFVRTL